MKLFNLPDLGEGLPDAEIVEWHVKEGDHVKEDQPMVSMETAKAVVDVPCPYTGVIAKLHGQPGDERAVARAGLCRPGLDLRQRHGGCLRGRLSRRDGLDARRVRPADDAGSGMAARRWELGHVGRRELPHRLVADGAGPMADLAHGRGGLLAHPASRPPLQL